MTFIDYSSIGEFKGEKYEESLEGLLETKEWREYKRIRGLEIELPKHGIPLHLINYSLDNYIGEDKNGNLDKVKKYLSKFEERFKNKCLYIYGDSGTQKTTIAQFIGLSLFEKGINVQYTTMNHLIRCLTNMQFKEDEEEQIYKFQESDLLILDRTFDKEQVTIYNSKYQLSFLDTFLRERIEREQKAMIIISNNSIQSISENKFNIDIQDLIERATFRGELALKFEDHYSLKDDFDASSLWD